MNKQHDGYTEVSFAPVRRMIVDVLEMGHRKHMIHGLIEADVTQARRYIHEYEASTGKDLSFTAFIVACLGKAVERNKYMHAYRRGRNRLVLFDEVDVSTQIEVRERLSVTVTFDHDIIDGAPAARFTERFKDLIELGYGLDDQDPGADGGA